MKIDTISKKTAGFTVMELMATLGVAALIMAIAVPAFNAWLPTVRLSSAARQVATDLQVARMRAISQNANNTVTFTGGTYTFTLSTDSRNVGAMFPGITISSVTANPVFTPRGTASTIGTITLSNGTANKTVQVSVVGRISIQ